MRITDSDFLQVFTENFRQVQLPGSGRHRIGFRVGGGINFHITDKTINQFHNTP